jgi:hypothetical protein
MLATHQARGSAVRLGQSRSGHTEEDACLARETTLLTVREAGLAGIDGSPFHLKTELVLIPDVDLVVTLSQESRYRSPRTPRLVRNLEFVNVDAQDSVVARDALLDLVFDPRASSRLSANEHSGYSGPVQSGVDRPLDFSIALLLHRFPQGIVVEPSPGRGIYDSAIADDTGSPDIRSVVEAEKYMSASHGGSISSD